MSQNEHSQRVCPGCAALTDGRFCSSCGQRTDVDPKTLSFWLRDALEETLSLDGTFLRSVRALALRPGFLTQEWRAGRRSTWTTPFRLYLLSSLLFFSASVVFPTGGSFSVGVVEPDLAMRAAVNAEQEATLATVAPQVLIAMVPVLALLLRVFFRGPLFVEHLVHAVHVQTFLFLILLTQFLGPLLPFQGRIALGIGLLAGIAAYFYASCRRVYGAGRIRALLGSGIVSFVYLAVVLIALGGVVGVATTPPRQAIEEAEAAYWELRDRWASGDTTASQARALQVAVGFRRLELHMVGTRQRAHAAEMLLTGDSVAAASTLAEQGLVEAPADPLLLGIAGAAAEAIGDSAAATRYYARLLDLDSLPVLDPRNQPDATRYRERAEVWSRLSPGGS